MLTCRHIVLEQLGLLWCKVTENWCVLKKGGGLAYSLKSVHQRKESISKLWKSTILGFIFTFYLKINRVSIKIMLSFLQIKLYPLTQIVFFLLCILLRVRSFNRTDSDVFLWWNTNQINKHLLTVFSRNVFKFGWMTKKLHDFEMLTDKERFQTKEKHLSHIASSGLEMCFGLTHVTEKADEMKRPFLIILTLKH